MIQRRTVTTWLVLFFIVVIIVIGCGIMEPDVINIAGEYSMSYEYDAICEGATQHVTGMVEPITITQDGDEISVDGKAIGRIDEESITFRGSIPLGSHSDTNLAFAGTVDDDGAISGTFSGTYTTMVWGGVWGIPYYMDCLITTGHFTLHPRGSR